MIVKIRHIELERGKRIGIINPSEIQSLIDLFETGVPVFDYTDSLTDGGTGFEDAKYYGHQIMKYEQSEPFHLEIIVS